MNLRLANALRKAARLIEGSPVAKTPAQRPRPRFNALFGLFVLIGFRQCARPARSRAPTVEDEDDDEDDYENATA